MDTKKMRARLDLLPPPGGDVVKDCLDEIDKLRSALDRLYTEILERGSDRLKSEIVCAIDQAGEALGVIDV